MKLFQDILKEILMEEEVQVVFPNLKMSPSELVEMRCYMALRQIKKFWRMTHWRIRNALQKLKKLCIFSK